MVGRVGTMADTDVVAYVEGFTPAELVAAGQRVSTTRITTDATRLWGFALDYYNGAPRPKRLLMPAVTARFLCAGINATAKGDERWSRRQAALTHRAGTKAEQEAAAESAREQLLARREILLVTLTALAGGHSTLLARVAAAGGTIGTDEAIRASIRGLIGLAEQFLDDESPGMVARRAECLIDTEWLAATEDLAQAYSDAALAAGAVLSKPSVEQSEVDYWDGVNLRLLGILLDAFEAAHRADPTIPRLVPIALWRWFHHPAGVAKPADPAAPVVTGDGPP
jgi:hypothetical protein